MKSLMFAAVAAPVLMGFILPASSARAQSPQEICETYSSEARFTPQQQIQACTTLLQTYQLSSTNRSITHYNRGRAWYDAGDQNAAIADYTESLRHDPNYAMAYYNRGTSYNETGRQAEAIVDFTAAIRLNPNYTNAYFNRGAAHARSGDYARAIEDFTTTIRLNPNLGVAYRNRSICYRRLGDTARADADAARAAQLGA